MVIRFPFPELFQQVGHAEDVDCTPEVIDRHDQGKLTVDFFQSPQVSVSVSPLSFDSSEDVFDDHLPPFVECCIFLQVFEVGFHCFGILASFYLPSPIFSSGAEVFDRTALTVRCPVFFEQVMIPFSGFFVPCSFGGECFSLWAGI